MAISPEFALRLAVEVRRLYAQAESLILAEIAARMSSDLNSDAWQVRKLQELQRVRLIVEKRIKELEKSTAPEDAITTAFNAGVSSADADLKKLGISISGAAGAFGTINTGALEALVASSHKLREDFHLQILRSTIDNYRRAVSESVGIMLTGSVTRLQAAQMVLNKLADSGIYTDPRGRNWDLASYAEMATRTAAGNAAIEGHLGRMTQHGQDLVIVSDHKEECPTCRPWERKILSISGKDTRYPPVSAARGAGLWHANCGHTINAYIPGITEVQTPESDPAGYETRKQQRYIERQIRRWKKRETVAISPEEKQKTSLKVRQWQSHMRTFITENDRTRKPYREQVRTGKPGGTA